MASACSARKWLALVGLALLLVSARAYQRLCDDPSPIVASELVPETARVSEADEDNAVDFVFDAANPLNVSTIPSGKMWDQQLSRGQVLILILDFAITASTVGHTLLEHGTAEARHVLGGTPNLDFVAAEPGRSPSNSSTLLGKRRLPVMASGIVVASRSYIKVGTRVSHGLFPLSRFVVATPVPAGEDAFLDRSGLWPAVHRPGERSELPQGLSDPVNKYRLSAEDAPDAEVGALRVLFNSSFYAGWVLPKAAAFWDATVFIITAASSLLGRSAVCSFKFLGSSVPVIGVTSKRNLNFTRSLDLYDQVLHYQEIREGLQNLSSPGQYPRIVVIDMAGDGDVMEALYSSLGPRIRYYWRYGTANPGAALALNSTWASATAAKYASVQPVMMTAASFLDVLHPMLERENTFGQQAEEAYAACWTRLVSSRRVERANGAKETLEVYRRMLKGQADPNVTYLCSLWPRGLELPRPATAAPTPKARSWAGGLRSSRTSSEELLACPAPAPVAPTMAPKSEALKASQVYLMRHDRLVLVIAVVVELSVIVAVLAGLYYFGVGSRHPRVRVIVLTIVSVIVPLPVFMVAPNLAFNDPLVGDIVVSRDSSVFAFALPSFGVGQLLNADEVLVQITDFYLTKTVVTDIMDGTFDDLFAFVHCDGKCKQPSVKGRGVVVASRSSVGAHVVGGWLPMSPYVVMKPDRLDAFMQLPPGVFVDAHPWRAHVPFEMKKLVFSLDPPSPVEDKAILDTFPLAGGWPLSQLAALHNATALILTSASSRVARVAACSARANGHKYSIIGITSARNFNFTKGLGLYDLVVTYQDLYAGFREQVNAPWRERIVVVEMTNNQWVVKALYESIGAGIVDFKRYAATQTLEAMSNAALLNPGHDLSNFTVRPSWAKSNVLNRYFDSVLKPGEAKQMREQASRVCLPAMRQVQRVEKAYGPEETIKVYNRFVAGDTDAGVTYVCSLWPKDHQVTLGPALPFNIVLGMAALCWLGISDRGSKKDAPKLD